MSIFTPRTPDQIDGQPVAIAVAVKHRNVAKNKTTAQVKKYPAYVINALVDFTSRAKMNNMIMAMIIPPKMMMLILPLPKNAVTIAPAAAIPATPRA